MSMYRITMRVKVWRNIEVTQVMEDDAMASASWLTKEGHALE